MATEEEVVADPCAGLLCVEDHTALPSTEATHNAIILVMTAEMTIGTTEDPTAGIVQPHTTVTGSQGRCRPAPIQASGTDRGVLRNAS